MSHKEKDIHSGTQGSPEQWNDRHVLANPLFHRTSLYLGKRLKTCKVKQPKNCKAWEKGDTNTPSPSGEISSSSSHWQSFTYSKFCALHRLLKLDLFQSGFCSGYGMETHWSPSVMTSREILIKLGQCYCCCSTWRQHLTLWSFDPPPHQYGYKRDSFAMADLLSFKKIIWRIEINTLHL